jgi:hypothetical protein
MPSTPGVFGFSLFFSFSDRDIASRYHTGLTIWSGACA